MDENLNGTPEPDATQPVERPGPDEVDAGDLEVPAPDSAAPPAVLPGTEVRYVFPIHVTVASGATRANSDDIITSIWNALYRALS
ncbi:hypothetical protein OG806_39990 [Streptomyces sp. NBC_00882]|uniref:hypothetical protein n=1 Tax=Streptomyces TaxID=1883 RepID=UPI0038642F72|nr:hypothetical protein OG806_39990 [Streptomyces sp. NBC_00882]WSZ62111.1 hypothetical protein OH824_38905 [Streptomyces canus]